MVYFVVACLGVFITSVSFFVQITRHYNEENNTKTTKIDLIRLPAIWHIAILFGIFYVLFEIFV